MLSNIYVYKKIIQNPMYGARYIVEQNELFVPSDKNTTKYNNDKHKKKHAKYVAHESQNDL